MIGIASSAHLVHCANKRNTAMKLLTKMVGGKFHGQIPRRPVGGRLPNAHKLKIVGMVPVRMVPVRMVPVVQHVKDTAEEYCVHHACKTTTLLQTVVSFVNQETFR